MNKTQRFTIGSIIVIAAIYGLLRFVNLLFAYALIAIIICGSLWLIRQYRK
ncbi:hypothetical protein LCGC14_1739970 [marine sediment metagenome]|uniref:Uncharacterized protein n=1 Tax=marine sediment metagenome TaxID=412755 RepID=A0A0F9HUK5_9ZZZZ